MVFVPEYRFDAPRTTLEPIAGTRVDASDPVGSCLTSLIDPFLNEPATLRSAIGPRLMRNFTELAATRLIAELQTLQPGKQPSSERVFRQLNGYICEHLRDHYLSPKAIADANFVSLRYAQAVFQQRGTTMNAWIRERRLTRVREDLADPRFQHLSVSDVASSWGFVNASAFSRAFQHIFGETPSQWRKREHYFDPTVPSL
ncbi:helix-turn-helix transcriptional regulator [Leucobacter insecticola]|uniref:Helix-turn-helix transcriptional regulator n=1 Tax=Leucobacter insecticola TaxID=2714934 RepID=A0A6G8FIU1_9MICO|nr:helix-turn-helix transcriptional regulator [Leucobacter insecticola]QIM16285.1 helix-turn-helix transcriptional regulator [Leucobacter insecticola]